MDEYETETPTQDYNDFYAPDPYTNNYQIDAKILSSDYKNAKILVRLPKFKKVITAIVEKTKDGKIKKTKEGYPITKKLIKTRILTGFTEKKIDLPISNIHNDSVTSSILTDSDVEMIRSIDDTLYDYMLDMVKNPQINFTKTCYRLNGLKASIVDSSKGRWGRSAELAKTQISKGESKTFAYHDQRTLEEFENRKKKGGLLGLGFFGL
ncbi:MAG: hypothetical protein ACOC2M_00550 [bacterium]